MTRPSVASRYLIRAVVPPWLALTFGLALLFALYALTRQLADATQTAVAPTLVLEAIALRAIVSLEVLMPLGLYLGLIVGLGRLYSDQEIVALQAGGLTRGQMVRPLLAVALLAAALTALLSLAVRPWAYGELYRLQDDAVSQMDIASIRPATFFTDSDSQMVVYAQRVEAAGQRLDDVFASVINNNKRTVIRAASMTREQQTGQPPTLVFHNGHLYQMDRSGEDDRVVEFRNLDWRLGVSDEAVRHRQKSIATAALWRAKDADDMAELQWRLSRPLATFLLALLGIVFARAAPRRGRAGNVFAATLIFVLYYNLAGIARTRVEHGHMSSFPGLYWVDALVAAIVALAWFVPRRGAY